MTLTTQGLIDLINRRAPFRLAESWDNSGLQAGKLTWPAKRILISLDVTMAVMETAVEWDADLVLTHHPLMITPEKKIDFDAMPGSAIALAAVNKISIVSAHTNLDKADNGLNDWLAGMLELKETRPLLQEAETSTDSISSGFGRVGTLDGSLTLHDFAVKVKQSMGLKGLRMVGDANLEIHKAALCSGSGASLLPEFFRSGAQVFVTGDVKYHDARQIEEAGKGLLDIGHFASEHIVVTYLEKWLRDEAEKLGVTLEIKGYDKEEDPFVTV